MLSGCIVATVTPFDDGKVNVRAFEKYISFLANSKIAGIVVCGSTGEPLSLTLEEKLGLISAARRVISKNGDIKLFAGVIDASTERCVDFIKKAEDSVDGFLTICPFYVKPSASQIYAHFKQISESTERSIILYDNPGRVGTAMELATVKKLSALKNVVGIKECSSDLSVFVTWRTAMRDDFALLSGNDDTAAAAVAMGASGMVSVVANVVPDLCVAMLAAYRQNNLERFAVVRDALQPLAKLMFAEPSPGPVKYTLSKMGFVKNELRMPMSPIGSSLCTKIDKIMRDMNLETLETEY